MRFVARHAAHRHGVDTRRAHPQHRGESQARRRSRPSILCDRRAGRFSATSPSCWRAWIGRSRASCAAWQRMPPGRWLRTAGQLDERAKSGVARRGPSTACGPNRGACRAMHRMTSPVEPGLAKTLRTERLLRMAASYRGLTTAGSAWRAWTPRPHDPASVRPTQRPPCAFPPAPATGVVSAAARRAADQLNLARPLRSAYTAYRFDVGRETFGRVRAGAGGGPALI